MKPIINVVGKRFGKLVVLARAEKDGRHIAWACKCDCGGQRTVRGDILRRGWAKNCGCSGRISGRFAAGHQPTREPVPERWVGIQDAVNMLHACMGTRA